MFNKVFIKLLNFNPTKYKQCHTTVEGMVRTVNLNDGNLKETTIIAIYELNDE